MDLLNSLGLFVRIAERGSLAAAGRDLSLSPAVVTDRLAALESHYGAKLLNRTTRSLSLTDEGRQLFEAARQLVSDANDIEARIRLGVEQLSGQIRLSAPTDLGRQLIAPVIDAFMQKNPNVSVEAVLSDGYADLVAQGIDLAVRFGELKDSSLHAVKLGTDRRIVCAAPSYVERCGRPQRPRDVLEHNCLLMRFGENVDREWAFLEGGRRSVYAVKGNRIANDGGLVRLWCIQGHGLALKSFWNVKDDLAAGRLIEVLAPFATRAAPIQAMYPGGRAMPGRVRALIDCLTSEFAKAGS
jgi:DNA-binding transcriptional LysR family regulator